MNNRIIVVILLGFLFSCGQKEQEVKDLSEILPSSSRDYSLASTEELENEEDSINFYKQQFLANGILIDNLHRLEGTSFPDRFNPKLSDRFDLVFGQDTVRYERWIYDDSSKVMSTFYNWLDCFGDDCNSLVIGEEKNLVNEPFELFVNDSTIILVKGDNDFDKWYRFHVAFGFGSDWKYLLEQKKSGKTQWFKYIEGERIPINQQENEDN